MSDRIEHGKPSMGPGSAYLKQALIWHHSTAVTNRRTIHTIPLNFAVYRCIFIIRLVGSFGYNQYFITRCHEYCLVPYRTVLLVSCIDRVQYFVTLCSTCYLSTVPYRVYRFYLCSRYIQNLKLASRHGVSPCLDVWYCNSKFPSSAGGQC